MDREKSLKITLFQHSYYTLQWKSRKKQRQGLLATLIYYYSHCFISLIYSTDLQLTVPNISMSFRIVYPIIPKQYVISPFLPPPRRGENKTSIHSFCSAYVSESSPYLPCHPNQESRNYPRISSPSYPQVHVIFNLDTIFTSNCFFTLFLSPSLCPCLNIHWRLVLCLVANTVPATLVMREIFVDIIILLNVMIENVNTEIHPSLLISFNWPKESWHLNLRVPFGNGNVKGLVGNWKKVVQLVRK